MSLTATSTQSRGHGIERFQMPMLLTPTNSVSTGNLAASAGTSLAQFRIPGSWGKVDVLAMGGWYSAAGGAQTTDGVAKLQIAGADVEDADGNDFELTSEVSHAINAHIETDLNSTTDPLAAPPSYPQATSDQLIEMLVKTQGAGAGSQTIYPYLIVRIANPQ